MTRKEQERFVRDLTGRVQKTLLERLPKVPEEWDGIELRSWIADLFVEQALSPRRMGLKRHRDYKNECLVRNLV